MLSFRKDYLNKFKIPFNRDSPFKYYKHLLLVYQIVSSSVSKDKLKANMFPFDTLKVDSANHFRVCL